MKRHIRPRVGGVSGTETVCVLTGMSPTAEGSTTSRVTVEVECALCRVGADQMTEAGDLLVSADGRWTLDDRPQEYRSVYAFVEYLGEDERRDFTVEELQELVRYTSRPFHETLAELRRMGFRLTRPEPQREVRGIGRLKPPSRADP